MDIIYFEINHRVDLHFGIRYKQYLKITKHHLIQGIGLPLLF